MRPRKDYGCPLRIYGCKNSTFRYTALPPRSARAAEAHKLATGWRALYCPYLQSSVHVAPLHLTVQQAGPHLGQRITWAELPPAVQAALRASFLCEYCPKDGAALDLLDLEAWAKRHAPEADKASRYLHADNRRAVLEAAWRAAQGAP